MLPRTGQHAVFSVQILAESIPSFNMGACSITGCCEAKPITPPRSAGVRGSYRSIVDYNHQPFSIIWSGSPQYPDLADFPFFKNINVTVSPVHQSLEMAAIWRDSALLDYGSYASIRVTEHDPFPVLKLAHSDKLSVYRAY